MSTPDEFPRQWLLETDINSRSKSVTVDIVLFLSDFSFTIDTVAESDPTYAALFATKNADNKVCEHQTLTTRYTAPIIIITHAHG